MFGNRTGAFRLKQRSILFRVGAIFLGLLPFLLFELVLHIVGWQQPNSIRDPYVGFTEIRPLFQVDDSGQNFEISQTRFPLFCPESFRVEKPDDEFRIFCVGGSTVQGRPFAIETSFSTWLELRLRSMDQSRNWNAINCGGVSYASYRIAPILEEIIEYQPDLIILYTGHNEFLEDRTYQAVKNTPAWIARTHDRLSILKSYSFVRNIFVNDEMANSNSVSSSEMPMEVEARLDFRGGMAEYRRDDQWKLDVVRHFEHNLRRMIKAARQAGVPLMLCNPVCNLRDASPFKSQNSEGLSVKQQARFDEIWDSLKLAKGEQPNLTEDLRQLKQLVSIDPRHAGLQYRIGQTYQQLNEFEKAKEHLVRAKEEDVCPLRMIEPMYDVIADLAREFDVPVVDVKARFEARASDRIPGSESLVDHVHPSIHGHQLISAWLMDEMIDQGWVDVTSDVNAYENAFESHLASLPFLYFELGKDRLAGLKRWAEGRVTREKTDEER